jgi:formylglycine-generating enzyme
MHHVQTFKDNPFTFTMRHVEGGIFDMGSNDKDAFEDEKPVFSVSVNDFWLGEYLVTQALWSIVMRDDNMFAPSRFKGHNHPIENVSWEDITNIFLPKLNEMTYDLRPKGSLYLLPTEIQWEYAAKGGKYQKEFLFKYAGSNKLNEVGWCNKNSHDETKPVGLKSPNFLGLYDMSGNIWEFCADQPSDGDYLMDKPYEFALIEERDYISRLIRGGGYHLDSRGCRSVNRAKRTQSIKVNFVSFRLMLI